MKNTVLTGGMDFLNEEDKNRLIADATKNDDYNLWTAELGYEDWMNIFVESGDEDELTEAEISRINTTLEEIWEEAHKQPNVIKEIRKELNMSQQRFADKFGIPKRTLQDWESGAHNAPDYVVDMINKIVQFETLAPMAWVFYEYRDRWGSGSTEIFTDKEEAVEHAKNEWNHMSAADQQSYIDDPVGEFFVALLPMLWDDVDLEFYPYFGDGYDPVWSAV